MEYVLECSVVLDLHEHTGRSLCPRRYMDLIYLRGGNSSLYFRGSFTTLEDSRNICGERGDIFSIAEFARGLLSAGNGRDVGLCNYRTLVGSEEGVGAAGGTWGDPERGAVAPQASPPPAQPQATRGQLVTRPMTGKAGRCWVETPTQTLPAGFPEESHFVCP